MRQHVSKVCVLWTAYVTPPVNQIWLFIVSLVAPPLSLPPGAA